MSTSKSQQASPFLPSSVAIKLISANTSPVQTLTASKDSSPVVAEVHQDASCQVSTVVRKSTSGTQVTQETQLQEDLRLKTAIIREMELNHADKMRHFREQDSAQIIHSRYASAKAQNEYLENLLHTATTRNEELEIRLEDAERQSPSNVQQLLISVTEAKLELQGAYTKLKSDYELASQNLRASENELQIVNNNLATTENFVHQLQQQFEKSC